jgi:aryl-alcohol dehydrogenase-like predicted oxidoreductase
MTMDGATCSEAQSHAVLDAYVAAGGNFIDTANIYAKGESEAILGRWLVKKAPVSFYARAPPPPRPKARTATTPTPP